MKIYHILQLQVVHIQTWKWELSKRKKSGHQKCAFYFKNFSFNALKKVKVFVCLPYTYTHASVLSQNRINLIKITGITSCWRLGTWEQHLACALDVLAPLLNSDPQIKHTDIFLWKRGFTGEAVGAWDGVSAEAGS